MRQKLVIVFDFALIYTDTHKHTQIPTHTYYTPHNPSQIAPHQFHIGHSNCFQIFFHFLFSTCFSAHTFSPFIHLFPTFLSVYIAYLFFYSFPLALRFRSYQLTSHYDPSSKTVSVPVDRYCYVHVGGHPDTGAGRPPYMNYNGPSVLN